MAGVLASGIQQLHNSVMNGLQACGGCMLSRASCKNSPVCKDAARNVLDEQPHLGLMGKGRICWQHNAVLNETYPQDPGRAQLLGRCSEEGRAQVELMCL